jgi:Spy/CpxP family protein refolding chaperone
MKKTLIGVGVVVTALSLAAVMVAAQGQAGPQSRGGRGMPGRGMGPGAPDRIGPGLAGLDLSEEQRTKIAAIHKAARGQTTQIEDELRNARTALHREIYSDARDSARVAELSAKIATTQTQLMQLHVKTEASVADVLTAEQRAALRLRDGRGGGPGPGRGRGRGVR